MNLPETDEIIIGCSCSALDHVVRFSSWSDGDCFVDVSFGRPDTFFRRLRSAWRFLTNQNCRFVTSAEVILDPKDVPRIRAWLDKAERTIKPPKRDQS